MGICVRENVFNSLPDSVLFEILRYLDVRDVFRLALTSNALYHDRRINNAGSIRNLSIDVSRTNASSRSNRHGGSLMTNSNMLPSVEGSHVRYRQYCASGFPSKLHRSLLHQVLLHLGTSLEAQQRSLLYRLIDRERSGARRSNANQCCLSASGGQSSGQFRDISQQYSFESAKRPSCRQGNLRNHVDSICRADDCMGASGIAASDPECCSNEVALCAGRSAHDGNTFRTIFESSTLAVRSGGASHYLNSSFGPLTRHNVWIFRPLVHPKASKASSDHSQGVVCSPFVCKRDTEFRGDNGTNNRACISSLWRLSLLFSSIENLRISGSKGGWDVEPPELLRCRVIPLLERNATALRCLQVTLDDVPLEDETSPDVPKFTMAAMGCGSGRIMFPLIRRLTLGCCLGIYKYIVQRCIFTEMQSCTLYLVVDEQHMQRPPIAMNEKWWPILQLAKDLVKLEHLRVLFSDKVWWAADERKLLDLEFFGALSTSVWRGLKSLQLTKLTPHLVRLLRARDLAKLNQIFIEVGHLEASSGGREAPLLYLSCIYPASLLSLLEENPALSVRFNRLTVFVRTQSRDELYLLAKVLRNVSVLTNLRFVFQFPNSGCVLADQVEPRPLFESTALSVNPADSESSSCGNGDFQEERIRTLECQGGCATVSFQPGRCRSVRDGAGAAAPINATSVPQVGSTDDVRGTADVPSMGPVTVEHVRRLSITGFNPLTNRLLSELVLPHACEIEVYRLRFNEGDCTHGTLSNRHLLTSHFVQPRVTTDGETRSSGIRMHCHCMGTKEDGAVSRGSHCGDCMGCDGQRAVNMPQKLSSATTKDRSVSSLGVNCSCLRIRTIALHYLLHSIPCVSTLVVKNHDFEMLRVCCTTSDFVSRIRVLHLHAHVLKFKQQAHRLMRILSLHTNLSVIEELVLLTRPESPFQVQGTTNLVRLLVLLNGLRRVKIQLNRHFPDGLHGDNCRNFGVTHSDLIVARANAIEKLIRHCFSEDDACDEDEVPSVSWLASWLHRQLNRRSLASLLRRCDGPVSNASVSVQDDCKQSNDQYSLLMANSLPSVDSQCEPTIKVGGEDCVMRIRPSDGVRVGEFGNESNEDVAERTDEIRRSYCGRAFDSAESGLLQRSESIFRHARVDNTAGDYDHRGSNNAPPRNGWLDGYGAFQVGLEYVGFRFVGLQDGDETRTWLPILQPITLIYEKNTGKVSSPVSSVFNIDSSRR